MCGIVGAVSVYAGGLTSNYLKVFNDLLIADTVRGPHGTGVFKVSANGKVEIRKLVGPASDLLRHKMYDGFGEQDHKNTITALIGHNRFMTTGKQINAHTHPFHAGKITLVHNGTLGDYKDLPDSKDFEVDSEAFTHAINQWGLQKVINNMWGAVATIYYDSETRELHIYRNSQRPLAVAKHKSWADYIFASEIDMLKWALKRNNCDSFEVRELPSWSHMTIDLLKGKMKEEELQREWSQSSNEFNSHQKKLELMEEDGTTWMKMGTGYARLPQGTKKPPETTNIVPFKKAAEAADDFLDSTASGRALRKVNKKVAKSFGKLTATGKFVNAKKFDTYSIGDEILVRAIDHEDTNKDAQLFTVLGERQDLETCHFRFAVQGMTKLDDMYFANGINCIVQNILESTVIDAKGQKSYIIWLQRAKALEDVTKSLDIKGQQLLTERDVTLVIPH